MNKNRNRVEAKKFDDCPSVHTNNTQRKRRDRTNV